MLGKIIPYLVVSVFNLFALVWLSQISLACGWPAAWACWWG